MKGRNVHRYDNWPHSGPFTKSIQSSLSTAFIRIISKCHESRGDPHRLQGIDFSKIPDDPRRRSLPAIPSD